MKTNKVKIDLSPKNYVNTAQIQETRKKKKNPWLQHVKKFKKLNNLKLKDALVASKVSYKKPSTVAVK